MPVILTREGEGMEPKAIFDKKQVQTNPKQQQKQSYGEKSMEYTKIHRLQTFSSS